MENNPNQYELIGRDELDISYEDDMGDEWLAETVEKLELEKAQLVARIKKIDSKLNIIADTLTRRNRGEE